jgi:hypothetical protein
MNWNALAAIATAVAAVAAAAGFLATVRQIKAAARQDRTEWEDELTREYRQIVRQLPLSARLNGQMQDGDIEKFLSIFLDYFDLSNQQVFLRKIGRVSRDTWKEWRLGIKGALQAGPFAAAWNIIKQRNPDLFAELKALEATGFDADPAGWKRLSR